MPKVSYERVGSAAVLTITRPERRNAVDDETAAELLDGFHRFEADDEARALVLTGEGPEAFCAGADLKAFAERAGVPGDHPEGARRGREAAIAAWLDQRPDGPARVHPPARPRSRRSPRSPAGAWPAGLELALWCDLRIATEDARLGFTERRFGVPLIDGGTQRLPRIVGMGRALGDDPHRPRRSRPPRRSTGGWSTEVVGRGRAPRARARDRRGPGRLPADDDALRPPRGDRGHRAAVRRRASRSRPSWAATR